MMRHRARWHTGYEDVPRPDLVLLDLNLPRKNGLDAFMGLTGAIRGFWLGVAQLPSA